MISRRSRRKQSSESPRNTSLLRPRALARSGRGSCCWQGRGIDDGFTNAALLDRADERLPEIGAAMKPMGGHVDMNDVNLNVEIEELTVDQLSEVSGGAGDQSGTAPGTGAGNGTGGGKQHWWAG